MFVRPCARVFMRLFETSFAWNSLIIIIFFLKFGNNASSGINFWAPFLTVFFTEKLKKKARKLFVRQTSQLLYLFYTY